MMLRTPPPSKRARLPSPEPESELLALQSLPPGSSFVASAPLHDTLIQYDCDDGADESLRCTYKCKQLVKSEVLESFESQEKKISEFTSQLQFYKTLAETAGLEKQNFLERIKMLEQEVAASTARERALQEQYKIDLECSEERFRMQLKQCEDLEVRMHQEMRHRAEAERKADAAARQAEDVKDAAAENTEKLKRDITQLEERLKKMQKDARFAVLKTEAETSAEKSKVQYAENEITILKAECEDTRQLLSKCMDEKRALSNQLAAASAQGPSSQSQEMELVIKHLRDELKSFELDVAEARKMKQFHVNVNLLKEKLKSERLRAERAEAALEELVNHEIQVRSLNEELQSWKSLIREIPDVERRDDIPKKIGELQRELLSATAEVGKLTAQVTELHADLEKAEVECRTAQSNVYNSKETMGDDALQTARLKRQVELLMKENNGLKSILSSYNEEEAIFTSRNKSDSEIHSLGSAGSSNEKRIQVLEALVQDLQREGDLLRSELAKVELKLGRGDYDPSSTKVVHMVENLDVNAEKKVLLAEIQSLREQVKALQDDTLSSGIAASKNAELSVLRDQVYSLEKREARYKKVFAEKISIFRQACCLLFGYTVEMSEEQQLSTGMTVTLFTLQSMYAQSEEESIVFQFESGHMNLLANDYTSSLEISRMVDVYLKKFNSIPAFTANLTSELFNKSTLN